MALLPSGYPSEMEFLFSRGCSNMRQGGEWRRCTIGGLKNGTNGGDIYPKRGVPRVGRSHRLGGRGDTFYD